VGPHLTQCAWGEAYLRAKLHLDPFNRVPQYTNVTDRQSGQDRQRSDSIERTNSFTNGRPEIAPWFWRCSDPDLHVLGNRLRSIGYS